MGKTITNEFGWSKSRHTIFTECQRSYFLRYYESWGGWETSAKAEARLAYVLKGLETRWSWSGKVVHDVVAGVLEDIRFGRPYDPAKKIADTRALMRADFAHSKRLLHHKAKLRKQFGGLVEHELALPVPPEEWKAIWENAEKGLTWWFASKWPELAKSLKPEQWLAADVRDFDNMVFQHDGIRTFAIPDFAYLDEKGAVVVDWKTGHPRESFDPGIVGYALSLEDKFGVAASTMRGLFVYLATGQEKELLIDEDLISRFEDYKRTSAHLMQGMLVDPTKNVPKKREHFPMTQDRDRCERCAYSKICKKERAVVDAPPADDVDDFR